jgi:peptidoglycan/LPS O-acetylase OafA/YrhL
MTGETPSSERYLVLDGLRGAAALVVITDHVYSKLLTTLLPGRYLAVDFFFALSGFVLAHVYGKRFIEGMTPLAFMGARIVRLYPLYICATLAGSALVIVRMLTGETISLSGWAATTLLNSVYLPTTPGLTTALDAPFPFNGPAWSLFFELVVNLAFALIVLRLTNRRIAALLAVSGAALVWVTFHYGTIDTGYCFTNFFGGFARVFYAFFAGVLVYRLREHWRPRALPAWLALVILLAVLALPLPDELRKPWDCVAAIVIFPLLIAFAADSKVSGVAARTCATAGALSYGFYVFQVPVRNWYGAFFYRADMPGVLAVLIIVVLTLLVVVILQNLYDRPVRRFLAERLPQLGARQGAASQESRGTP